MEHKGTKMRRGFAIPLLGVFVFLCSVFFLSCSASSPGYERDKDLAYAYHYRDLDSVEYYAKWRDGMFSSPDAEQYNNQAFVRMVKMDYVEAERLLLEIPRITDNQVELLVCYVQQMRLCQRCSRNREFYEYRERALSCLKRIDEERDYLPERLQRRMIYAESELAIVNSAYYYYVGLERQSIEALQAIDLDAVRRDTAQYLNYLYNVGAGGIITDGTPEQIRDEEMDYLNRCLAIAQRYHYPYFEAQAKEALAEHTGDLALAEEALELFRQYGDVYQTAGAYRTLASCYHAMGDDLSALDNLQLALADTVINQAPDLVASIREQMSVAYAAVNDKPQSDFNRNIYIDLQEQTRQDRELEARAAMLDKEVGQLNWMILAVLGAIVLLLFLLWLFNHLHQKRKDDHQLDDLLEQKNEEVAEARLRVGNNERRNLEQRAKVSLAVSILPLIDRILYAVGHKPLDVEYIRELTDNINEQNDLLTQWIQLRQGELSLHIESFPLNQLFGIVARSQRSFAMKGIALDVRPTETTVKADRVLTLFMLNTLADNARKFTPRGGTVTISAEEADGYVEVSVADTGQGMSADALAHVFDAKPIRDEGTLHTASGAPRSHGFGLMNCRGIIEKYRKMSQLFSVCQLSAESEQGRGSRFYFRLPKGVLRCWVAGVGCWLAASGAWATDQPPTTVTQQLSPAIRHPLDQAHIYADSAYFSNINGTYERTLLFADSCRQCLNDYYRQQHPDGRLLMTREGDQSAIPPEIQWLHDSVSTNYQIILDIRNESAVAALALHDWSLYAYNNKVYTQLFKELSADNTLDNYCRTMQQSQQNKRIAVILLLVLLVLIVPAYYLLYYRHRLYDRYRRERLQQTNIELAEDELRRAELEDSNLHVANAVLDNCLSTLKHETMYYPSRIRQLADAGDISALAEVTTYYRDLYAILTQQAISQVEQQKLHVRPVTIHGQTALGDENLLRYLFGMLKAGDVTATVRDERYVVYHAACSQPLSPITFLLCRQIVRDHGEATNRRGCGITTENHHINITLPRYNGKL